MAILVQILIMQERYNQFENKLSAIKNKHKALNNRVSEIEEAIAKASDLQSQATRKLLDANQILPAICKEDVVGTVRTKVNDRMSIMKNIVV